MIRNLKRGSGDVDQSRGWGNRSQPGVGMDFSILTRDFDEICEI